VNFLEIFGHGTLWNKECDWIFEVLVPDAGTSLHEHRHAFLLFARWHEQSLAAL